MVSYPLVPRGDIVAGRVGMSPDELNRTMEDSFLQLDVAHAGFKMHALSGHPVARTQGLGDLGGGRIYADGAHGFPDAVNVPMRDSGRTHRVAKARYARSLAKRRSVRSLRRQDWILQFSCYGGAGFDPNLPYRHLQIRLPFVPDVLDPDTRPLGQLSSNETGNRVIAFDRETILWRLPDADGTDVRGFGPSSSLSGAGGRRIRFSPEPTGMELVRRAKIAGLLGGELPVTPGILEVARRLVYALREKFGYDVDGKPYYNELLMGIGALEIMRRKDPLLSAFGPFHMGLFERAALAYRDSLPGVHDGPLDAEDYRRFLLSRALVEGIRLFQPGGQSP
jgi:hypothetical protein